MEDINVIYDCDKFILEATYQAIRTHYNLLLRKQPYQPNYDLYLINLLLRYTHLIFITFTLTTIFRVNVVGMYFMCHKLTLYYNSTLE